MTKPTIQDLRDTVDRLALAEHVAYCNMTNANNIHHNAQADHFLAREALKEALAADPDPDPDQWHNLAYEPLPPDGTKVRIWVPSHNSDPTEDGERSGIVWTDQPGIQMVGDGNDIWESSEFTHWRLAAPPPSVRSKM